MGMPLGERLDCLNLVVAETPGHGRKCVLACLALILAEIFIYPLAAADSVSDIRVSFFRLPAWTHDQRLSGNPFGL